MSKRQRISADMLKRYEGKYIMEDELKNLPFISTAKSGKRWYWVGWFDYSFAPDNDIDENTGLKRPDAEGYADTKEQALKDGRKALGIKIPDPLPEYVVFESRMWDSKSSYVIYPIKKTQIERLMGYGGSGQARERIKFINAKKKYEKENSFGGSGQAMEFAYSDGLGRNMWEHRIIKRTKKKVFIEADFYRGKDFNVDGFDAYLGRQMAVDRERFDAGEEIWVRKYQCRIFNEKRKQEINQEQERRQAEMYGQISAQFEFLEIDLPTTKDQVKRAYRQKAKVLHPDAGGSGQDFAKLNEEYQQAIAMAGA